MKKLATALSAILLSACHVTWGPHNLTLTSIEGVSLTSRKGEVVEFPSEAEASVTASYVGSKKVLTLSQTGLSGKTQAFDFKNVVFNQNDDSLVGNQTDTGQNLAILVKRSFNGENVSEREYVRGCTYYESHPVTHCHGGYHHHADCTTEWEQYPVRGEERVRERTTVRAYTVSGALSQSVGTMAQLNGSYNDTNTAYTSLTVCR